MARGVLCSGGAGGAQRRRSFPRLARLAEVTVVSTHAGPVKLRESMRRGKGESEIIHPLAEVRY